MSTEKKLQHYLHLYIGCQVQYEGIVNGKELKAELQANKHDVFYTPQVKEEKGMKLGYLREVCYRQTGGYARCKVGRKSLKSYWGNPCIKLILRPLSDMTEEDGLAYAKLTRPEATKAKIESGQVWSFHDPDGITFYKWKAHKLHESCPEEFLWLLSKHFDLFGLIDAGLAIDKSKIVV